MKVAVVILNWNGCEMLRRFLPTVLATTPASIAQVIVADNGSTDGSVEMLHSEFARAVEVIELGHNYGYAQGYNRALAQVDAEFAVLLNSDVAPADGWLAPLVEIMQSNTEIAACQPKLLSVDNHSMFEYAGASGGFIDRHGYPYCRGRLFDTVEPDEGQYDTVADVDWASGAALMVRLDVYRAIGGLDSDFFAHMEEIDLCWRLRRAGWRVVAVPSSVVFHLGGGALPQGSPRKTFLNFRNNLLMLYKNLAPGRRRRELIVRRLLDTIAWARFVVTGRWAHARAVFKAHSDYRRVIKTKGDDYGVITLDAVCSGADAPALKGDNLKGRPDILVKYYLRRRRRYSDL